MHLKMCVPKRRRHCSVLSWVCKQISTSDVVFHSTPTGTKPCFTAATVLTNMAWWRFRRFWFFVLLCAFTKTCSGDGHCDSFRSPLMQNVRVPWARFLKNTTQTFYGPLFGSVMVLPNNSFVLSPFIYVCIHTSCPYTCWETVSV